MKKERKVYRNGDWTFIEVSEKLEGKELKHNGSFVFAEGEATGHFHTIVAPKKKDLRIVKTPNGDYMFVLESEARITHPEHSMKVDIVLPPGTYRLQQRREKDWMSMVTRKVID